MRYFITLSYDGTRYHGWQIQPNGISVQEELQKALSTLLRQPIEVVGAGRTDAGVHAKMMVCHTDILPQSPNPSSNEGAQVSASVDCEQLKYKLNKILPPDIAIQKVEPVSDDMHARFSATSRTYHYFIHSDKDPFQRQYSWRILGKPLDFEKMNEAAKVIMEYEDFTSFSKVNTDVKTNICHITEAHWEISPTTSQEGESEQAVFVITANRFLRNMVRAIVGTLVEVGRGKITIDDVRRIIEAKDRCKAGESVPGNALFLWDIKY